jgi:hypothetical protein
VTSIAASIVNPKLAEAWQRQIAWCIKGGSPLTARVLEAAWNDWLEGGTPRELMPDWAGDPWLDAVPLRVAGALHSLVLEGLDPSLTANYPPQSNEFDPVTGSDAVRRALRVHRDRVFDYLRRPPQTNEIGRSAILLGGFACIAQRTGLALALCEIGASAGLNLLWHRYRYELGATRWGDPASPVTIRSDWRGVAPPLPANIAVASWRGCDVAPIDLAAPHAATRLASYVWPDQPERLQRLQAAVALAKAVGMHVERTDAAVFVARELAVLREGEATVVYHSIVWQYLGADTRQAITSSIEEAGTRATHAAPLAWLAFEVPYPQARAQLVLRRWPGDVRVVLAEVHPHGQFVRWGEAAG